MSVDPFGSRSCRMMLNPAEARAVGFPGTEVGGRSAWAAPGAQQLNWMHDRRHKSLYRAALASFAGAWVSLCSPWLGGQLTIPYDAKAHFQAQLQFLANALHTGQSPFWAPNVFAGSPQIADPQSLIFSPALLVAYLSAEPSFALVDAYVLFMLGCAGCAVLWFFRDRGWNPSGAIVAALAFAFGASAAWRVQHIGQVQSYALFAISLWLLARALQRSSAAWGAAAGLSIGIMIVEPNQVALLAGYVLVGFVITYILQDQSPFASLRRLMVPLSSAGIIALMVALVPVILTYLFIEESNRPAIAFDEAARKWLSEKGYDRLFGARPLGRVIQEHIKKPLAEELLFGKLTKGGIVRVTREGDKLGFTFADAPPRAPAPKEPELVEP